MQKRHNSIANALELFLFCIEPLYCGYKMIIVHFYADIVLLYELHILKLKDIYIYWRAISI